VEKKSNRQTGEAQKLLDLDATFRHYTKRIESIRDALNDFRSKRYLSEVSFEQHIQDLNQMAIDIVELKKRIRQSNDRRRFTPLLNCIHKAMQEFDLAQREYDISKKVITRRCYTCIENARKALDNFLDHYS
jgi:hypothetical protein